MLIFKPQVCFNSGLLLSWQSSSFLSLSTIFPLISFFLIHSIITCTRYISVLDSCFGHLNMLVFSFWKWLAYLILSKHFQRSVLITLLILVTLLQPVCHVILCEPLYCGLFGLGVGEVVKSSHCCPLVNRRS